MSLTMADKGTWGKAKEALQAAASIKNFREVMRGFWGVFVWASICDGFSSIPYIGLVFSAIGYGTIWLYLEMKGVSASPFGSTKKMSSFTAEWIAGAIGLSIVPGVTIWTYFCIEEYKAGQKIPREELGDMEKSTKETQEKLAKDALNDQEGGRQAEPSKERRNKSAYMKP